MESKFTKEQFLESKQFEQEERYLLEVLLEENKTYTMKEVKELLKKEKKIIFQSLLIQIYDLPYGKVRKL